MSVYKEVEVLRDPDGVICVITEKKSQGRTYHSFSFMKEYQDSSGEVRRTGFFSRRHTGALRRLMFRIEEWLDREVERTIAKRQSQVR